MKREIIVLMSVLFVFQNGLIVNANTINNQSEVVTDSKLIDGTVNGETVIAENIDKLESNSEEIDVIPMSEGLQDNEIQQFGSTTFDDCIVSDIGDASIKNEIIINDNALTLYPTSLLL